MQDFVILIVVLVAGIFVVRSLLRSYQAGKSGKCSCSGGCSGCGKEVGAVCTPQNKENGEEK